MSKVRSDNITNRADDGAPKLVFGAEVPVGYGITGAGGINITGVATAASFSGNLTGNASGTATGLSGSPNITVGNITASSGDLTVRNITGVAATFTGVLTYEDVTNVDSIGIITARSGVSIADSIFHTGDDNTAIRFPAADTFTVETAGTERVRIHPSGISHFKSGLAEKVNIKTQLTSANACAITDGNVILTTGNEPGNTYPDITGVHTVLAIGEGFSVTIALKVNGSGTINQFHIDGAQQTVEWSGGSAPSAGSSGYDVFTFSAFKTGSGTTDYKVFGAATNYD